jgi:outer membrane protein assembly factor BamB
MHTRFCALIVLSFTLSAGSALAAEGDWPSWRGPLRDGVCTEKGLLTSWPSGGPKLAWSARGLGSGYASVAILGDKVYTCGTQRDKVVLICVNRADGSRLWATPIGGGGEGNCTPTVSPDGKYAVAMTKDGDVLCVDAQSGAERWTKNFGRDFGGRMMSGWGYSESPLIDGDRVILTPGGDDAMLAAIELATGNVVWKTSAPDLGNRGGAGAAYSSIIISNAAGVKQYVQLVGRGLIGVDAKTGRLLWHYPRIANNTANIPTPIADGNMIFTSTGYFAGSALLQLSRTSSGVAVREVKFFTGDELQVHHGGMVKVGDYIYGGHGHNLGFPFCLNWKTGKMAWLEDDQQLKRLESAAVLYADGHLYFRYQKSVMKLIEATPRGYKEKGSFNVPGSDSPGWQHPVIAGGRLYLRNQDELFVYDIKAGS